MIRVQEREVRMTTTEAKELADALEERGDTSLATALDEARSMIARGSAVAAQVAIWVDG